ncbi:MAG: PAS domain S-box protein [Lachnospiraceae bacterium]|nr:PAS domain S-box protein [Lachnospiraceae bacterium]
MIKKIFNAILSVATAVLLASLIIVTGVLYQYFGNVQEEQLRDELSLAVSATEELGKDYLDGLDFERYRLTWVDQNGTVIFDSHADITAMENHIDREEIKEALISGKGSSVRQSTTLTEQTIYESARLNDGSVLRISVSRASALVLVLGMIQPIAVVMLGAMLLSAWLAYRMAKRVVEPLNNLNLENPLENEIYEELSPLLFRIHVQHMEIKNQMLTLKHKQEEFDQIADNLKEALVLLDYDRRIISMNPAAKVLFGAGDSSIGKDFLTIDRKLQMRAALEQAQKNGHADFRTNKNGKEYQFDLSRIDSDGKNQGIVSLAFDITEQVNAENHRREFTANVSHELKTPLQSIIGSAELMENGIIKEEDMPRFIGHIRKEASRLVDLIEDIIRLSQLDEGTEMPYEEVSLKELSEEVCENLTDVAKLKEVSLEVNGDKGVINGARRLLYEIIYNLCDNAIKYNRQGGSVKVSIEQKVGEVLLSIQDTGIGIPTEYHDKVFERFFRVDKSHSKQPGGTGLGLSIVKHAVQYHHGKITLESEQNKGTKISVLFDTRV